MSAEIGIIKHKIRKRAAAKRQADEAQLLEKLRRGQGGFQAQDQSDEACHEHPIVKDYVLDDT